MANVPRVQRFEAAESVPVDHAVGVARPCSAPLANPTRDTGDDWHTIKPVLVLDQLVGHLVRVGKVGLRLAFEGTTCPLFVDDHADALN